MKQCSKCAETKPLEEFVNDYRLKSGKGSKCLACVSSYHRKFRKDGRIAPPSPEQEEKNRAARAEWAKANREKRRATYSAWAKQNPELVKSRTHQRRSKLREQAFKITRKELQKLYAQPCFACGSRERIEIDHIIPLSKNGRHSIGNLQALCRSCNASKGNKFLIVFMKQNNLQN